MSEWKEVELGSLADIKGGKRLPKGKMLVEHKTDHPYIRVSDINNNKIDINGLLFVEPEVQKTIKRYTVNEGDIILSIVGTIGLVAIIPNFLDSANLTENCVKLKIKSNSLDNRYLYHYLSSKTGKEEIDSLTVGSTQPKLPLYNIKKIKLFLPPLPEQERIAEVLSSLDDKIDLLQRQNKTLEEMAETLFRQWFVEEAEIKPVKYFGKIICGKTPSKNNSNFFNGPIPFLKIPDMHGKAFVFKTTDSLTEEGKQSQSNKTIPPLSISVSCIATVGLVTINAFECQTNQQINSIVPNKKNYRYYLYNYFKSITDDLIQRASSGSVTHNLNTSDFSNIEIPFFSDDLFKSFDDVVDPLYQKIFINEQQIQQLEALRDTLLPKLMSGELRVN